MGRERQFWTQQLVAIGGMADQLGDVPHVGKTEIIVYVFTGR